jgi:hypothetical protein
LGLDCASKFACTSTTLDGSRDDDREFESTMRGMEGLRFAKQDRDSLLSMVAAALHLSNINFQEENDWDGNASATLDLKDPSLNHAAKLLQVSVQELKDGLCTRVIVTGRESTRKPETREKAMLSRDALCKSLYSKMFDKIVRLINDSLRAGIDSAQRAGAQARANVSVLDIFGFESFEKNHFEQLCINHANERLQLHFNHYTFLQERTMLEAEGLQLSESDFTDNAACVALLEESWGIQATLDDVCKTPKGDDKTLLERLSATPAIRDHPYFHTPKKKNGTFVVRHYAGDVAYSVDGMVERNKDTLPASVVALMQRSQNATFASAFDAQEAEPAAASTSRGSQREGASKMGGKSVYAQFKADLKELVLSIEASSPHFVRCINPNAEKRPDHFVDCKVVEQLRCGGVIEAVRMARESFPGRASFDDFCQAYVSVLCPDIAKALPAKSRCLACMKVLGADPSSFFVGKSLVLMRREVSDLLERHRSDLLKKMVVLLQAQARCVTTRVKYVRLLQRAREAEARERLEASRLAAERAAMESQKRAQENAAATGRRPAIPNLPPLPGIEDCETESGMSTERTQSSEATEAPTVASGDEEGMLARLNAMGIGQAAVQHVIWVNDARNSSHRDSRAPSFAGDNEETPEPPEIEGLVPLREGGAHWAGLPITATPPQGPQQKDPIVELIACRDKEVRRVILWSRRRLDKTVLLRMLRYSIYEAELMERFWQPPPQQAGGKAAAQPARRQLFRFAGDAARMRERWARMTPRDQKEFCRLDTGRNQRDLLERIIQGFGYAPRFCNVSLNSLSCPVDFFSAP